MKPLASLRIFLRRLRATLPLFTLVIAVSLCVGHHGTDIVSIPFRDGDDFAEAVFAITGFVLEQVIFTSTAAHYFATACEPKALGGGSAGFEFCHGFS
jgi:peptidoglycan/LPS O-acetylase OafA/YrhL